MTKPAKLKTKPSVATRRTAKALHMLVVNTTPQLRLAFPDHDATISVTRKRLAQIPPGDGDHYGLIVAETPAEWKKDGDRIQQLMEHQPNGCMLIGPALLLQRTAPAIQALGKALCAPTSNGSDADHAAEGAASDEHENGGDFLHGYVQRKLLRFVKAYSESGGRDLYGVMMKEFERPLLEFALAQTGGNQRRAADLLGVNRNTLRKRMQGCGLAEQAATTRRRTR